MDKVPPGQYDLVAWHPVLGAKQQEVIVDAGGNVHVDFEFKR